MAEESPAASPTAITISLLNMKGGVGKTTLAVNLAWQLSRKLKKRVLLVDLDPQFNASQYLMTFKEWTDHRAKNGTIADLLLDLRTSTLRLKKGRNGSPSLAAIIRKCIFRREDSEHGGSLHLLPSELVLARAVKNPQGVSYKLEKALNHIRSGYDFVFIDCAPTDSVLTDTALTASDFVLIPVKPDRFSALGYAAIQETLDAFREESHDPHSVRELGVVFNNVYGDSDIEDDCMADVASQADYVFTSRIAVSRSYMRAIHAKTPVFDTPYTRFKTKWRMSSLVAEMTDRLEALSV